MSIRLPRTEATPLFYDEVGEHAEHLLKLVGTRPPTTRMLLDRHPPGDGTTQEAQCTG